MEDLFTKGKRKSLNIRVFEPHPTTSSLFLIAWDFNEQPIYGVPGNRSKGSRFQEKAGHRFGRWTLLTNQVFRSPELYRCMKVQCECGTVMFRDCRNLQKGESMGCDHCAHKDRKFCRAPEWLVSRMEAASGRCNNPADPVYKWYGARGIQFRFGSPIRAANWIMDNLGLKKHLTIDREDNDGHYEPGNLRYATVREQIMNTRIKKLSLVYFAEEWPYEEQVVRKYLKLGMTREQVMDQARKAVKEKRKRWRVIQHRLSTLTTY